MLDSAESINLKYFRWILIALTVFAFVTRLVSIDHQLPYQIVSDEGSDLTASVRLLQGELPAPAIRYHRLLIAYNNLIPISGVFALNVIDGDVRSIADFENLYFANRAEFTYATRLWMAILSSAAVFFTGLAGSNISRRAGLLAALILCLNSYFFHTSLFALPDALGTCMTAFGVWGIIRVWKYRRTVDYILMSLLLALVMLAKLQASIIGVGFLVAHAYVSYDKADGDWKRLPLQYFLDKNFWIAAIAGIAGNVMFNPVAFYFFGDFLYEIERAFGAFFGDVTPPLDYRLDIYKREAIHVILIISRWITIPIGIAIIAVLHHRKKAPYVIIAVMMLALTYLIINSRVSYLSHFYYWNPIIIPVALMGAIGSDYLIEGLQSLNRKYSFAILIAVVSLIVVLEGMFFYRMFTIMNTKTTQELARNWITENVPADTAILMGDTIIYSVPLYRNETSILNARNIGNSNVAQWNWILEQSPENRPSPAYTVYGAEYREVVDSYDDLTALIADENLEYVVFADYRCLDEADDPTNNSAQVFPPRSEALIDNWELVFSTSSFESGECDAGIHQRTKLTFSEMLYQQVRMGPYIEIYRIP